MNLNLNYSFHPLSPRLHSYLCYFIYKKKYFHFFSTPYLLVREHWNNSDIAPIGQYLPATSFSVSFIDYFIINWNWSCATDIASLHSLLHKVQGIAESVNKFIFHIDMSVEKYFYSLNCSKKATLVKITSYLSARESTSRRRDHLIDDDTNKNTRNGGEKEMKFFFFISLRKMLIWI